MGPSKQKHYTMRMLLEDIETDAYQCRAEYNDNAFDKKYCTNNNPAFNLMLGHHTGAIYTFTKEYLDKGGKNWSHFKKKMIEMDKKQRKDKIKETERDKKKDRKGKQALR